jgi:parallel beta-helix repeat protein
VHSSSNNSIIENKIADNYLGVGLVYSSNYNSIIGNEFVASGLRADNSYNNIVQGNTVNGKPLIYLECVSNHTVTDAGQVVLVKCANIKVEKTTYPRHPSECSCGKQIIQP